MLVHPKSMIVKHQLSPPTCPTSPFYSLKSVGCSMRYVFYSLIPALHTFQDVHDMGECLFVYSEFTGRRDNQWTYNFHHVLVACRSQNRYFRRKLEILRNPWRLVAPRRRSRRLIVQIMTIWMTLYHTWRRMWGEVGGGTMGQQVKKIKSLNWLPLHQKMRPGAQNCGHGPYRWYLVFKATL